MGHGEAWWTGPDGVLVAASGDLRLVVQAPEEARGATRFLVLRLDGEGEVLLGSGTEDSVRAALRAAARMAGRTSARPLGPW